MTTHFLGTPGLPSPLLPVPQRSLQKDGAMTPKHRGVELITRSLQSFPNFDHFSPSFGPSCGDPHFFSLPRLGRHGPRWRPWGGKLVCLPVLGIGPVFAWAPGQRPANRAASSEWEHAAAATFSNLCTAGGSGPTKRSRCILALRCGAHLSLIWPTLTNVSTSSCDGFVSVIREGIKGSALSTRSRDNHGWQRKRDELLAHGKAGVYSFLN